MEEMNNSEPSFSLNDFRKWVSKQKVESYKTTKFKGYVVESRLSVKKLVTRIDVDQGDLYEMAKDFKKRGGTVLECDTNNLLLVEVRSGTFRIPKLFVNIISKIGDES